MEYKVTVNDGPEIAAFADESYAVMFVKTLASNYKGDDQTLIKILTDDDVPLRVNVKAIFNRWTQSGSWSKIVAAHRDPNSKAHFAARNAVNADRNITQDSATFPAHIAERIVKDLGKRDLISQDEVNICVGLIGL